MKLDDIKKLHQKKYRNEFGCYLVEGEHLIQELEKVAANNSNFRTAKLYVTEKYQDWPTKLEKVLVSELQMTKLSDTKTPQGIIAVVPFTAQPTPPVKTEAEKSIYLFEVQDPGNLGTILRTLAWFGGFKCVLSPNSVDPYNPKVVRASMGAIFHVPIEVDVSLGELQTRFERFACLDIEGDALSAPTFTEHQCFIFGNEARGLPREQFSELNVQSFSIKGNGALESLNLAAAVNICAYELNR